MNRSRTPSVNCVLWGRDFIKVGQLTNPFLREDVYSLKYQISTYLPAPVHGSIMPEGMCEMKVAMHVIVPETAIATVIRG
jgi:hypothetical protein